MHKILVILRVGRYIRCIIRFSRWTRRFLRWQQYVEAGFGTVFELEDSKVGIGTDAATHTLQALGNIRSEACN